jgi:hypothetical protein
VYNFKFQYPYARATRQKLVARRRLRAVYLSVLPSYLSITTSFLSIMTSFLSITKIQKTVTLKNEVATLKRSKLMLKKNLGSKLLLGSEARSAGFTFCRLRVRKASRYIYINDKTVEPLVNRKTSWARRARSFVILRRDGNCHLAPGLIPTPGYLRPALASCTADLSDQRTGSQLRAS